MIKSIRIKNFRCLRDVTVALDSLTVLVGPNGSGKSTLLDAIVTLARLTRSPLHGKSGEFDFGRPGWQGSASFEQAVFAQNPRSDIHFDAELTSPTGEGRYTVILGRHDNRLQVMAETLRWVGNGLDVDLDLERDSIELKAYREPVSLRLPRDATLPFRVYPLRHELAEHPVVRAGLAVQRALGPSHIHEFVPSRLAAPAPHLDLMRSDGYGLVSVLDEALGRNRQSFENIERDLQALFPEVVGLVIQPFPKRRGEKELLLRMRSASTSYQTIEVPAGMAPSGVLVVIALLWVLHFHPYAVVSLDEIEVHMHPWLLGKLLRMVEQIANDSQVLLATHSPETLNMLGTLDPVRICESTTDGCRILSPAQDFNNQRNLKELFQQAVGAMWFSGQLGGVPVESDK